MTAVLQYMYHDRIIENNSMLSIVDHNGIGNSGAHAETFSCHICIKINVIVNPSLMCYQTSYIFVLF
jgi:hypothetical protein